jgi:PAS domain S-box-containing protein
MKLQPAILLTVGVSLRGYAAPFAVFELEDGHTNWQYVANTSASLLIIALTYTLVRLVVSNRRAKRYNQELEAVRSQLEQRVLERTATLEESNRQLQQSNQILEDEIADHRETTARLRMSEAYISSILDSMPTMLIGLNQQGEITQWNRRAEEISGLAAERAMGRNLWQAYPPITLSPDQVQEASRLQRALSVKQSQRDQFYFDITIYPLQAQGETDVVVMIDDVTQRVIAENKLIQRDKMSSMGELAASMAHDIEAPLQGIMEDVRTLQAALPDAPAALRDTLQDALDRGAQGSAVIGNLLEFSASSAGEKQAADITRLLDHSVELAASMLSVPSGLRFADISIIRNYGAHLPQVSCYVAELQQVFLSLLRHCCQALDQPGRDDFHPTIVLDVHHYYEALWIRISHNGRAMDLEEQQHLFEPYFIDGSDAAREDYDAGRRLSFPHFIITEQLRGQLAVTSSIEDGTTFHIQLRAE